MLPVLGAILGGAAIGSSILGGRQQAKAAKQSADAQLQAGQEGMALTRESRDLARGDLAPFRTFGEGVLPQLQNMLTPEGQAAYANENNPIFRAALDNMNRRTAINAAITGRTGAGDTNQQYLQNWQAAAMPLIQNQQNMLFNAANMGQSSAAGQANTAMTAGANLSSLRTDMGAAQAGGIVGAANAKASMYKDVTRGVTSFVNPNATGWSDLFKIK